MVLSDERRPVQDLAWLIALDIYAFKHEHSVISIKRGMIIGEQAKKIRRYKGAYH